LGCLSALIFHFVDLCFEGDKTEGDCIDVSAQTSSIIQKNALRSAIISSVVNGVLAWLMFQSKATRPLTVDAISSQEQRVFSRGVNVSITIQESSEYDSSGSI
jgi:hypothetical protein